MQSRMCMCMCLSYDQFRYPLQITDNDRQRRIETSARHLRRRDEAVKKPARSSLISANCVCTQRRQVEDLLSAPSGASLPIAEKTATARESPRVRKGRGNSEA